MVERLFLAVPRGCLQFVIVVFPDHTHLLFLAQKKQESNNSIIDYHRRALKIYTLIPNNLNSHDSHAQQWTSTNVYARHGGQVLNI